MLGPIFVTSYAICCGAFVGLAVHTLLGRPAGELRNLIVLASVITAVWAGCVSASFAFAWFPGVLEDVGECIRDFAWLIALTTLLQRVSSPDNVRRRQLLTSRALLPVGLIVAILAAVPYVTTAEGLHGPVLLAHRVVMTLVAVFGLVILEELLTRSDPSARWGVKHLCLALATLFVLDLLVYSDALLLQGLPAEFVMVRGPALAVTVPLLMVSVRRMDSWRSHSSQSMFTASRAATMHSIALVGSGTYLLAVAMVAFLVRRLSGNWGLSLQIMLMVGGVLLIVVVLSSGRIKSQFKILIYKTFFTYKYDYREEWRQFSSMMSAHQMLTTGEKIIRSFANMMDSPAAALWLWNRHDESFVPSAAWNYHGLRPSAHLESPFVSYLVNTNWVIEIAAARRAMDDYPGLSLPEWITDHPQAWLVVPIAHRGEMLAFLVLDEARTPRRLDWEDYDLLKTAAAHAASFLAAELASEAASDARKIEEFNRRFAFVVHDIKNVVGQMSLMLDNTERFGDDPNFQRDVMDTARNSVARLKGLLEQLAAGRRQPEVKPTRTNLAASANSVVERWRRSGANVCADIPDSPIYALAIEASVIAVLDLIIDNAIGAAGPESSVTVKVRTVDHKAILEIIDDGPGMDMEFVRNELFRPLRSTKRSGYGIGAYQSRHLIQEMGGQLEVDTAPSKGTTMRILLPLDLPMEEEGVGATN